MGSQLVYCPIRFKAKVFQRMHINCTRIIRGHFEDLKSFSTKLSPEFVMYQAFLLSFFADASAICPFLIFMLTLSFILIGFLSFAFSYPVLRSSELNVVKPSNFSK